MSANQNRLFLFVAGVAGQVQYQILVGLPRTWNSWVSTFPNLQLLTDVLLYKNAHLLPDRGRDRVLAL